MPDKNAQELVACVVTRFYEKATIDIMIGYHFRKIQVSEQEETGHPLKPPMEAFRSHIPRIISFWEIQLLGKSTRKEPSFQLIDVHKQLNVLPGEVGRWAQLFQEVLEDKKEELGKKLENENISTDHHQIENHLKLLQAWQQKVENFKDIFMNSPRLFHSSS